MDKDEKIALKKHIRDSLEGIVIRLAGSDYHVNVWVVWSDVMDGLGMPLIGTDVLNGQDLLLDFKTGELVGRNNVRVPCFEEEYGTNGQRKSVVKVNTEEVSHHRRTL
ncbi:hypothetical protein RvY_03131 [Ramazzottius varieornatus]|uniref:Uncharacterized protein n=1 Tax=Ramazzottius varieornatus TaxID=947166 RepID=A0A1D1UU25_RAMVA|nr:hypothetical protein RvY_03131 [Ramazzottius varieornatus]